VADAAEFKYRAFLSYSHRDQAWGKWLHSTLEAYRIDKDLVGRETPAGKVPKSLRPIFRDREDFSAGHSLTAQTLAALESSQFLIVICSPSAARSEYVNEEVRRFKVLGREERVLAVIVDGEPGDPHDECFPPALRFKIREDGSLSDERQDPIAADARTRGDGKHISCVKLIAGLLGLGLDEIVRRSERARRRRNRMLAGVAASFLFLAIAASGSAIYAYQKLLESEERLDQAIEIAYGFVSEATGMSDRFGIPTDVSLALLRRADAALNKLVSRGADTNGLRFRQALMLISFSDSYEKLGKTEDGIQRAIEANKLLEALVVANPSRTDWHQSFLRSAIQAGVLLTSGRKFTEALDIYRKGLAAAEQFAHDYSTSLETIPLRVRLNINIGNVLLTRGQVSEATNSYLEGLNAITQFASGTAGTDPSNLMQAVNKFPYLSYISVQAADRLTDLQTLRGMYAEALRYRQGMLPYREIMARFDAQSISAQWGLLDSQVQVANSLLDTGAVDEAFGSFNSARAIAERLSGVDPTNIAYKRLAAIAIDGVGRTLLAQGKHTEALATFRKNFEIAKPFIDADRGNVAWQANLAIGYERIGDALMRLDEFEAALTEFRSAHSVLSAIPTDGTRDAEVRPRLAILHFKSGEALLGLGQRDEAVREFRNSLVFWQADIAANPEYRDVAMYNIYLFQSVWRISQNDGDVAAFKNARQLLRLFAERKMLGAEDRWWLSRAEAQLAQSKVGHIPGELLDCVELNPERTIASCSQVIEAGMHDPAALAKAHKLRGDAYVAARQLELALRDYADAIGLDRTYAIAYNERGRTYELLGRVDDAIADYTEAVDLDGSSAVLRAGHSVQAIEDYNEAVRLDPQNAIARDNRGYWYFQSGRVEDALADFSEAMRLSPDFANAYINRATARAATGEYDGALADWNAAIRLEPKRALNYNMRGLVYLKKDDLTRAEGDFSEAIRLDPSLTPAYSNRGDIYRAVGRLEAAVADYTEAIRLNPTAAGFYNTRGLSYQNLGKLDAAITDLDEAIRLNPSFAIAYSNRGLAYENNGDLARAIVEYNEALRLDPANPISHNNRGSARSAIGRLDEAIEDFDEVIRLKANLAPTHNMRGVAYLKKGELDRALADFQEALQLDPKSAVAYSNIGLVQATREHFAEAIANYTAAIRLDPKNALAFFNRGSALSNISQLESAANDFSEAIRINPGYVLAYANRGTIFMTLGKLDAAIADLGDAVRLDPSLTVAFNMRGVAHLRKNDFDRALSDFSEAIRLDPYNAIGHTNRGRVYELQGRFDEAIAEHDAAIRINPRFGFAFANRGLAYEGKGDRARALAEFEAALALDPNLERAVEGRARLMAAWPESAKR
jgi:tetratricopeptide (TPR) repeat protein